MVQLKGLFKLTPSIAIKYFTSYVTYWFSDDRFTVYKKY